MDLFFETASPSTLACLIADIQMLGTASREQLRLEKLATQVLVANVGEDEARQLIAGEVIAR